MVILTKTMHKNLYKMDLSGQKWLYVVKKSCIIKVSNYKGVTVCSLVNILTPLMKRVE